MLIADELRSSTLVSDVEAEIADRIERWFEPQPAMDLKVRICELALFHAYLDPDYPPLIQGELLRYWLGLQNTTSLAHEAFSSYIIRGPKQFVSVAEALLGEQDFGSTLDFFTYSFCKYRDNPHVAADLVPAISRWLRYFHIHGSADWSSDGNRREETRSRISQRIGQNVSAGPVVFCGFDLIFVENGHPLRLGGLAIKIISAGARRGFVNALTTWAVGMALTESNYLNKEFEWLLRLGAC
jgi:hypothetical protein